MTLPAAQAPLGPPSAPPIVTPTGLARVTFRAMGTDVEVLLPIGREAAAREVVATFAAWERRCSRFDPTSELSRLNTAAGAPVVVSRGLFDVIATAFDAARATDGIFDPTVLHRLEELGYDRTFAEVAGTDSAAADAGAAPAARPVRRSVGRWREVRLDRASRVVELPPGVGIDLGGIAKGMTVDAALAALVDADIGAAAVNAGGDLAVHGTPPGVDVWLIGVETIDGGEPVAVTHGALATSSTARRHWARNGRAYHHILDPRTGLPAASGITSVTVAAATCAQAEVAAKCALILGLPAADGFLGRAGISAVVIDDAGIRHRLGRWTTPVGADSDRADGAGEVDAA